MKPSLVNGGYLKDIHIQEVIRGGGIFLIIRILGAFGAYLFAWYVSKEYGAEGNGVFAFALTVAVLLAALFNLGLNTYTVKIISVFRAQGKTGAGHVFFRKALKLVLWITLMGCGLLWIASWMVTDGELSRDLFLISLMTVPVSILLLVSHRYKADKKIAGHSFLQNNVVQFFALIILLLPLWNRAEKTEPVWAFIVAGVIICFLGWIGLRSGSPTVSGLQENSQSIRSHVRASFPMLAGGMAFMVLNLSDRIMIRLLDSTEQLGIYDVSLRLSNLTLLGNLSLNAIAEPKFAEFHAQNDIQKLRKFVGRMTWGGILISIPVIGILVIFPNFWLGLFGDGEDFLTGIPSLYILLAGQAFTIGCGAVLVLLNMIGLQHSVQTILITAASINIILNAILIPKIGIEGAAIATAFTTLLWNVWGLWVIKRKMGFWMWG